jgi:hypothetical protein
MVSAIQIGPIDYFSPDQFRGGLSCRLYLDGSKKVQVSTWAFSLTPTTRKTLINPTHHDRKKDEFAAMPERISPAFECLLLLHIVAGGSALAFALIASSLKICNYPHKWHVYSGRASYWTMVLTFTTAVPLAVIARNAFLLFIAIFSFYLAWSGWRYAKRRSTSPQTLDRFGAATMLLVSLAMIGAGISLSARGDAIGMVLSIFGVIGTSLSIPDLRVQDYDQEQRISGHLVRMLGATTATVTAFLLTNVRVDRPWLLWLSPTLVIIPLIFWLKKRIRSGSQR